MKSTEPTLALASGFLGVLLAISGCAANGDRARSNAGTPKMAVTAPAHQRLVTLEGGQNFRDLGGYAAADGKTVKWGMLYRSGSMHNLTPTDLKHLEDDLGVRTVVDFRSTSERTAEPVVWPAAKAPTVLEQDYKMDNAAIMKAFARPDYTADDLRAAMTATYQEFPFQFASQYRRMFEKLVAGDAPLAFNCSAGKDRTGVAAALLLTVLGASRETIVNDYLLSNEYYRPTAPKPGANGNSPMAALAAMPADRMKPLQGVERQYIEATFAAIDKRPGGMDAFINEQLGLTKHDVATLRKRYLQ